MNANERPTRRRSEEGGRREGRSGGRETVRPSVRPSTSLNGRRTCGRAGGRSSGRRNTKCAVGNQSGTLRRVRVRPSVRRPQAADEQALSAARPPSQSARSFLPAILPAWLIWAALSLTHCMVALDAAVAAGAALPLLPSLPPLHGHPAAVVVTPRRGRPLRQDGRRRLRPLEERRGQAGWHRLPAGRSGGGDGGGGSRGCHFTFYSSYCCRGSALSRTAGRAASSASKRRATAGLRSHARDF